MQTPPHDDIGHFDHTQAGGTGARHPVDVRAGHVLRVERPDAFEGRPAEEHRPEHDDPCRVRVESEAADGRGAEVGAHELHHASDHGVGRVGAVDAREPALERVRLPDVVGVEGREQRAARLGHAAVASRCDPGCRLAHDPDVARVALEHPRGAVGGAVVDDHHLAGTRRLPEDAVERLRDVPLAVAYGHDHAHAVVGLGHAASSTLRTVAATLRRSVPRSRR